MAIQFIGDEFRIEHIQDNRPIMAQVKAEKAANTRNGWSENRMFQKIGSIPALEYFKLCKINPRMREPKELEKWLMSWEGAAYRTAEDNPHRHPGIIIK